MAVKNGSKLPSIAVARHRSEHLRSRRAGSKLGGRERVNLKLTRQLLGFRNTEEPRIARSPMRTWTSFRLYTNSRLLVGLVSLYSTLVELSE
jgi:hypothetical protein